VKNNFIKAANEYNTFECHVPAPYLRKSFSADDDHHATLRIACCGFYRLFLNGKELTKGLLAPYISNPNDIVYFDEYQIRLNKGENAIGIWLGNGFQNNPGGYIWDFDKADFRSAPTVSLALQYHNVNGEVVTIVSDESFKAAPSPIFTDDYRFGEGYDANAELVGWCDIGFDDSNWKNAIKAEPPKGELRRCEATPIVVEKELSPVRIYKEGDGYIYDFGESNAGTCRVEICGQKGQQITLQHADLIQEDGSLFLEKNWFKREKWEGDRLIVHKDTYVCKGEGKEIYQPSFTYHGFRYVKVCGITESQATPQLLTYVVFHSKLNSRGDFHCSDEVVNRLQEITRRSDLSNFHYFPTDCPQREKNGWTADAALSAEQVLLNFDPEKNYLEWMRNVCKAQNEQGALPGIVPTTGWGFHWGNGPAWDQVLAVIPYYTYVYRGETDMITLCAPHLIKYLHYLESRMDENGLLAIGLGDWCHVGRKRPKAPLIVTDSIIAMDIAEKTALMLDAIGDTLQKDFCLRFASKMKTAIRANLIDLDTMVAHGDCQTSQAMCIFYNVFTEQEKPQAFSYLLSLIEQEDEHFDVGVLGGRVLFYVLSDFGYGDLALHMIARPDYPSYGDWLKRGATTLWENFHPESVNSPNHHFWGHISGWFITHLAGIRFNPSKKDTGEVHIKPDFVAKLQFAEGYYEAPMGKILSRWEKKEDRILLTLEIPEGMNAKAFLPKGYSFEDGTSEKCVTSGSYTILPVS
jgi:alpha-L-rhamnosidase